MKIQEKIKMFAEYYTTSRQVGNTTLMKQGTDNYDRPFKVIVHNMNSGQSIGVKSTQCLSLGWMKSYTLRGENFPIIFDNGAMYTLFDEVMLEFNRMEEENHQLKNKINQINDIIKS